jgi:hypothetical protein
MKITLTIKNATASQISDRIKSLPSWQNATGLFGEKLVNDSAALSIANKHLRTRSVKVQWLVCNS